MSPSSMRICPDCALRSRMIPVACLALAIVYAIPSAANATYDPKHGRWLQRDPLGYIDGMNLYEYVKSRPTILYDPSGLQDPSGMAFEYKPYWRFVAGMGHFNVDFGACSKWNAQKRLGPYGIASSGMIATFLADPAAFKAKSCCTEVKFFQIYYVNTTPRNRVGDLTNEKWVIDRDDDGSKWYPTTILGNPQQNIRVAQMTDDPHNRYSVTNYHHAFETCAVCSNPKKARGEVYGCFQWIHDFTFASASWSQWGKRGALTSWWRKLDGVWWGSGTAGKRQVTSVLESTKVYGEVLKESKVTIGGVAHPHTSPQATWQNARIMGKQPTQEMRKWLDSAFRSVSGKP